MPVRGDDRIEVTTVSSDELLPSALGEDTRITGWTDPPPHLTPASPATTRWFSR